ncbi:MAG: Crp/Fnr family transcriptional regulator [Defluviitaleaceae bacterium]|nr:Crp/Fnr family transcriptional regulator [Defluviitaleaceae bacterium]
MKNIFDLAKSNPIFKGIDCSDFKNILDSLQASIFSYNKGDVIMLAGKPRRFGIVLSGTVRVTKEDIDGNLVILADIPAPGIFNEVCVAAGLDYCPHTAYALENCEVVLIDYGNITASHTADSRFQALLLENMLASVANKAVILDQRVEILSKHTIRKKLLCFLELQGRGAKKFTIPYNREEMARYICVDRSALSHELSKMRDEGLIRFQRNEFEIM